MFSGSKYSPVLTQWKFSCICIVHLYITSICTSKLWRRSHRNKSYVRVEYRVHRHIILRYLYKFINGLKGVTFNKMGCIIISYV